MKIEAVDFFYLSMPEVLNIGDGSQDALLVRVQGGGEVGWGECEAAPLVSIAHSGGQAVALAALAEDFLGVGVDVELPRRVTDPVAALAFTDAERQSLAALAGDWPARFWCGKEAVAKAVGVGLQGGPQAWAVARVDADREILWLSPPGAGAQPVAVQTGRLGELMLACAGVQAVPDEQ